MPIPSVDHAPLAAVTGGPLRPGGLELTERVLRLMALPEGARVLDAGCGNGASLALLHRHGVRPVGIDLSSANLAQARARGAALPLARADVARLPLANGCLHGLLCECVLSLAPAPGAVLAEFYRVLRPGGALGLCDMYIRNSGAHPGGQAQTPRTCVEGARSGGELARLLLDAGFRVTLFEDHSRHLAHLAGQLILSHGSIEAFWSSLQPEKAQRAGCHVFRPARPGYCLVVARKKSESSQIPWSPAWTRSPST